MWRNNPLKLLVRAKRLTIAVTGTATRRARASLDKQEITVPHERHSEFEPIIVKKRQTRFDGFDDKILSLYVRGMSTRDIQAQLQDLYGVD
ncbi:hypothetical protein C7B61_15365, partial [filamentous cyanobacterium CCP1]